MQISQTNIEVIKNDIIQYYERYCIDILLLNLSPDIDPGTWPQKDMRHTPLPLVGLCTQTEKTSHYKEASWLVPFVTDDVHK